ncbi:hypothetical protein [Zobellia russellii]|uniref:hypothetical protein n=1 Tax=Zobellia russellii TaxID=248907 RepID=UPI0037DD5709
MKKLALFVIICAFYSCGSAKYDYFFDTGKELDFSTGKWIMNRTVSNSKKFDNKLYYNSVEDFKKILGDSLIEIHTLRASKLIAPEIKFNLSDVELEDLKTATDCDYIINVGGNVISDGAGSISFEGETSSNRASVSISIYDLNSGELISSSQVYGKTLPNQEPIFPDDKSIPSINPSSHMIMLKGARKLIQKYQKNRLN